jgi:acyl carrier protein
VPVGVPAELFIAGAGLARGYLNRPELTAKKFVTLHLPGLTPQRAYGSGDLVRWTPEGCLEFLGRLDSQVKIRGFRIELGEIESVLVQHPAVKEAVVLAREDNPGEKRLAAYIIPVPGEGFTPGELRAFLKERLPDFMLPAVFVFLDSFPLTPNGKINRRALPAPDPVRLDPSEPPAPPRSPVEEQLAVIWKRVLGLEQVGVDDNFFDLGGHSLKATQVISRLRKAFNIEMPLRSLFESPTISSLARRIEAALLRLSSGEGGDVASADERPSGTIQPAPRHFHRSDRGNLPPSENHE